MLVFPNCKINLGLHVTEKRPDGFHNIETVFYAIGWHDALEVLENTGSADPFLFSQSGLAIEGPSENNLIYKAWRLMREQKNCPQVRVHLHKHIPMGAGLGGGSADAAFFINTFNDTFNLGFSYEERLSLAAQLGSDCAFFIGNAPVLARGRGNEFSPIRVDLSAYYILVVYPGIHSNTREAYQGLTPKQPAGDLKAIIEKEPVLHWKQLLVNDFETSIFKKHPAVQALKQDLYDAGALYASMSGSGSAVFGIFKNEPQITLSTNYSHCLQKPVTKVL